MPAIHYVWDGNGGATNMTTQPGGWKAVVGATHGVAPALADIVDNFTASVSGGTCLAGSVTCSGYVTIANATFNGTANITGSAYITGNTFQAVTALSGVAGQLDSNTFNAAWSVSASPLTSNQFNASGTLNGGTHTGGNTAADGTQVTINSANYGGGDSYYDAIYEMDGGMNYNAAATARHRISFDGGATWYYPTAQLPALNKVKNDTTYGLGLGTLDITADNIYQSVTLATGTFLRPARQ